MLVMTAVALGFTGCSSASPDGDTGGSGGSVGGSGASSGSGGASASGGHATGAVSATGGSASQPTCGDRNLTISEPFPDSMLIQNGGRIYNVRKPPKGQRAAVGDGVADDTEALRDAWEFLKAAFLVDKWGSAERYAVYLPDGTYLVSDTLIYRGASLEAPTGYDWLDVVNVRFLGQSREGTRIQLKDKLPGFGDASKPKIVLAYQHPDTRFNNIPANNALRNLTLDTGRGNPGAVGLFFQGANLSALSNVLIRSGDGQGKYGLWIKIGSAQGYYRDLTVDGFDYGIYQQEEGEVNTAFEHVTLRNQKTAAVRAAAGLSGRDLCVDETATQAQGLVVDEVGAQVVLLDSSFKGKSARAAIELSLDTGQSLMARGISVTGYASAITRNSKVVVAGTTIDEYVALTPVSPFGEPTHSLGLPIEQSPLVAWGEPAKDWAIVDDYGAVGDGKTDDLKAVNAAMNSGRRVVVFPKQAYHLSGQISVPATVERIDFMWSDLGNTFIHISEASDKPLLLEHRGGYGRTVLDVVRTTVVSELSGGFSNSQTKPVKVFIENAANVGGDERFAPPGTSVWGRGLNCENGDGAVADFLATGGRLWIFDYKTENKPVSSLVARSGSEVEVFNGYVNTTGAPGATPMIVNDHAKVSFVGFTSLWSDQWTTAIEERRTAETRTVAFTDLPVRAAHGTNAFIPLYFGDATK